MKLYTRALFTIIRSNHLTFRYVQDTNDKRNYADGLKIVTDIEGGNVHNVRRLSENHFTIQMKQEVPSAYRYPDHHSYWFYFKIEGVKGKETKISLTNCDWMLGHWRNYKPVYSYTKDPDSVRGVVWHRIEKTRLRWNTFSFVQRFEQDSVWVALRYPYNYTRQKRYIDTIRNNECVDIEELGMTVMRNPLYMILVTDKGVSKDKKKGVLVYAREHGVEQDGSWVTEGMIDFLLSSEPSADMLRRNLILLIVPIISPDAAIFGRAVDPVTGRCLGGELTKNSTDSIEARLLYNRVKQFVAEGTSLDIAISFHNPHGTEPNLYPNYRPHNDIIQLEKCKRLHKAVVKNSQGYTTWKEFAAKSCISSVGRFARDFGAVAILYEVNHQAKDNYLSLEQLKGMGKVFSKGIADYYGLGQ